MPRKPTELRAERARFEAIILPALGPRTRVQSDEEGWPMVPGRLGRLEWRGVEAGAGPAKGSSRVHAFTDRPRMIPRLLAVPGVHRWQIGDTEAAGWIAADDVVALRAAAGLLQTRTRRAPETGRSAEYLAGVRPRPEAANGPLEAA